MNASVDIGYVRLTASEKNEIAREMMARLIMIRAMERRRREIAEWRESLH